MRDASAPLEYILAILPYPRDDVIDAILKRLESRHNVDVVEFFHVGYNSFRDNANIPEDSWKRATILVTLASLPPDISLVNNLKFIHLVTAGANHITNTPTWSATNIIITNSSGIHGPQIAEWAVMQILSFSHKQKVMIEWQKKHLWGSHHDIGPVHDLVGLRLGVLGYGSIGRQMARICKAMGMDVLAYTASPCQTPESKHDHGYIVPTTGDPEGLIPSAWYSGLDKESLHHFLGQDLDILLIAVPQTPKTTHLLGKEEFAILGKRNAFVINIARGAIVVQDEMIKALKTGVLRGAALDVTDPEPLPKDSQIWELENVSITPHVSGLGTMYLPRSLEILEINLDNIEAGKPMINLIDREKGY